MFFFSQAFLESVVNSLKKEEELQTIIKIRCAEMFQRLIKLWEILKVYWDWVIL